MDEIINESQVLDFIDYNIRKSIEINDITADEAVESVRYYMDFLVNEVASNINGVHM